ncbi:phage portal protein [Methylosinus sp. LW4]|uniref:phage portal protein n=1 Tax=Methylosinus sp. LW4 TaxID=136993 RepID=UPI000374BEAE|nr:phage portal protein [Methylosinus sp. LW4]
MWPFSRRRTDAPAAKKIEPALHSAPAAAPPYEAKASAVGAIISARVLNLPQWPRRSFEKSATEGYQQNPVVNACIWKTTRAAAAVPLAIMRGDKEVEIPELRALLNRPNPAQDGPAFVQATLSDLMLAGEFFAERVDLGKRPKELYRWSPAKTAVRPGADGFAAAYTFKVGDKERTVEVDLSKGNVPVLHVRDYNPTDDWRGLPSIDPAAFSIDAHTGALRWNVALLRNGAQPSGALVYDPKEGSDKLTDEQWERLKAELEESFSGAKNAGRPLLLDGGLDWKEMGFSPKDMNFAEGLNSSARLIALAFGVPPLILGIPGDNTFANYAEANKAWYRETILPLLSQWCRAMSWWIAPAFGTDIRIEPDTDDLEVFAEERAAEWDRIEKSTILTIDEKRERLGYGDYKPSSAPGGQILVSSALIPLEATGETPQGDAAPEDDTEGAGDDDGTEEPAA